MPTRIRKDLGPGDPPQLQMGAIPRSFGVEFVLFSRHATAVSLLLYDRPDDDPAEEIVLDAKTHRMGDLWYVFVPEATVGQLYAFQVDGPRDVYQGHRFDPSLCLIDPCAKALAGDITNRDRTHSAVRGTNRERPKSVVVRDRFDWQDIQPPATPLADTVIYEMHVRGMTAHSNSNVEHPGSYLGVIEKIPYLKELGITAVELLPIQQFDPFENEHVNPETGKPLTNYWGYSPIAFFAAHSGYAFSRSPGAQVREFKTMVRELHRAGIEIILDVVFNHTGEGNHAGPIISFKGIDNSIFYFLNDDDPSLYKDFSGCGNSLNSNHPVVQDLIRACLRYWVNHMHIDGFRFDLASVLSRDRSGHLISNPPILESIAEDPVLRRVKIIAEAWDAAGAYQVGSFPGGRWAEWNGHYRDDIRQFWRGDPGKTGALATRITGSSDLYQSSKRQPCHSINFVTCHDGFTLNDLVSYNQKHNFANGEDNRDGEDHNNSYNHGFEGPTDDPVIERLRIRQIKNFLATLFLSHGVPMLPAGDEFRRTQRGNNNAYCQDNEVSWIDWSLLEKNREIFRFAQGLISFRRRHPVFRRSDFFYGVKFPGRVMPDISWYGIDGKPKEWFRDDHTLVCLIDGLPPPGSNDIADDDMLLFFNAGLKALPFALPPGDDPARPWRLFLDTAQESPAEIFTDESGPTFKPGSRYPMLERSMACFSRPKQ